MGDLEFYLSVHLKFGKVDFKVKRWVGEKKYGIHVDFDVDHLQEMPIGGVYPRFAVTHIHVGGKQNEKPTG